MEDRRFVDRDYIDRLAHELGSEPIIVVGYLLKMGYLRRIFKGFFYVSTPGDLKMGGQEYSLLEFISKGLAHKGVSNWYFGLQSALKLNLMTHEYFTIEYIISDIFRTTKAIPIAGSPVRFYQWTSKLIIPGSIIKKKTRHGVEIRYSNPEKTVIDLAYWRYTNRLADCAGPFREYGEQCDQNKLKRYLDVFPAGFRNSICHDEYAGTR